MHSNPYQSLVSLLSNILEAYTTAFFIVDPKSRLLNLAAAQTLSKFLPETISIPLEHSGILSQVQKVGQTIHLDKLPEVSATLSSTVPFYRDGESHIKGLFAVPVGDGAGVLYVDTKYGWGFNDKQQKWIREIAAVLNELLQRQECLTQERDYSHIFTFWQRLDEAAAKDMALEETCQLIVNESSQLLGTDYGFMALRESGADHFHLVSSTPNVPRNLMNQRFSQKQGLVGWVFQNQKNLLISKLNPQTADHYLYTAAEGLPHHGTFWGLPAQMSLGHTIVLAFLSRQAMEWGPDYQYAVFHMLRLFNLQLEKFSFKEECEHLQTYDLSTNLYNALAFEARLEGILTASMQNSTPFTLALLQFEPWKTLLSNTSPKQARLWQRELALQFCEALPPNVMIGQITDNRIGLLFSEMTLQDSKYPLSQMMDLGQQFFAGKPKGIRLQPYLGSVGFPQDGTRSEELWPLVYRRLFLSLRSKE